MINRLEIKNYQSLHDVAFELAPLTVLVGPSSSGKSAVTRALRALASNQTGKDFITHGQSTCTIKATTDKGTLVLTKGKPQDSYVILPADDEKNPRPYTKLGVGVPADVTTFLGIAPKDAINFAGQFDMPYLLRTSPTEVARVLGELTNVSSIFEAAREALRLKNEYSRTLKMRESDLAVATPKIESYRALGDQMRAVEAAEQHHAAAEALADRLTRLQEQVMRLEVAATRLRIATVATERPLPSTETAEALYGRREALKAALTRLQVSAKRVALADERTAEYDETIANLTEQYQQKLIEAGTCPVCHQSTTELEHRHA